MALESIEQKSPTADQTTDKDILELLLAKVEDLTDEQIDQYAERLNDAGRTMFEDMNEDDKMKVVLLDSLKPKEFKRVWDGMASGKLGYFPGLHDLSNQIMFADQFRKQYMKKSPNNNTGLAA